MEFHKGMWLEIVKHLMENESPNPVVYKDYLQILKEVKHNEGIIKIDLHQETIQELITYLIGHLE